MIVVVLLFELGCALVGVNAQLGVQSNVMCLMCQIVNFTGSPLIILTAERFMELILKKYFCLN